MSFPTFVVFLAPVAARAATCDVAIGHIGRSRVDLTRWRVDQANGSLLVRARAMKWGQLRPNLEAINVDPANGHPTCDHSASADTITSLLR